MIFKRICILCSAFFTILCSYKEESVGMLAIQQERNLGYILDSFMHQKLSVIDSNEYSYAYEYIYSVRDLIFNSDSLLRKNAYNYNIRLADNNSINSIVLPGGYIYLYTGMLQALQNEAQVAGLIGHLMSHCDARHTISIIENSKGIDELLRIINTKDLEETNVMAEEIIEGGVYKYIESQEFEADKLALYFMLSTSYNPLGIKSFWDNLFSLYDSENTINFFNDHGNFETRSTYILNIYGNIGEPAGNLFTSEYTIFKDSLP